MLAGGWVVFLGYSSFTTCLIDSARYKTNDLGGPYNPKQKIKRDLIALTMLILEVMMYWYIHHNLIITQSLGSKAEFVLFKNIGITDAIFKCKIKY